MIYSKKCKTIIVENRSVLPGSESWGLWLHRDLRKHSGIIKVLHILFVVVMT